MWTEGRLGATRSYLQPVGDIEVDFGDALHTVVEELGGLGGREAFLRAREVCQQRAQAAAASNRLPGVSGGLHKLRPGA